MRVDAFTYVQDLVEGSIAGVKVESFGSFTSKTYLPNSDIDLAVMKEDGNDRKLY